ncbi:hypothetical protein [Blastopirellula marina]|nr:hypothetical protein [Blastopirellula marina]
MKNGIFTLSLVLLATLLTGGAQGATIFVIEGAPSEEPVKMSIEDLAMIHPSAIAGSIITVKAEGLAQARLYDVQKINGEMPLLGPANKRVLVLPVGKGKVKVNVKIKSPTSNSVTIQTYEFEVK